MKKITYFLLFMTIGVLGLSSDPQTLDPAADISQRKSSDSFQTHEFASNTSEDIVKVSESKNNRLIEYLISASGPLLGVIGVVVIAIFGIRRAQMDARYNYAAEILKLRLRQVEEFYSPAFLLVEQSRIVYDKLLWTILHKKPDFNLDGFRLLDHIYDFQQDSNLKPFIGRILTIGKTLTNLIQKKSGLVEGELSPIFMEYQAHFDILEAASQQKISEDQRAGYHEFGYYPRLLNREIREGYKVIIAHLKNYSEAGDKTICHLLKQKYPHLVEYRQQMMRNLLYYENHAEEYISQADSFDISRFRNHFLDMLESTTKERSINAENAVPAIIDVGCGSGRDTLEFIKNGYTVIAIDASPSMCRECKRRLRNARQESELSDTAIANSRCIEKAFDEIEFQSEFDGVWAAASLLHVKPADMKNVLNRIMRALKPGGILYMSLKYGRGEQEYNTRFFSYFSKRKVKTLLLNLKMAIILKIWCSDSAGKDLSPTKQACCWIKERFNSYNRDLWLNVIVKKQSHTVT